jgi:hypothetical protein
MGISPFPLGAIAPVTQDWNELLIISICETDNILLAKKDGTYSGLFELIGFLIVNALTRQNVH